MLSEQRLTLRNVGKINPESIEDYIAAGGYEALKKARTMERVELIASMEKSGQLRGRGGAGFNTGLKWSSAYSVESETKYVVCNADEGEPGTYKDRIILEGDPHTVIEGMLICAYAIGANEAYVYCRGEYEKSIVLLRKAIAQANEKGLTENVMIKVYSGAGSYVCGEETALLNSLEGKRAEPRLKPPFPTVAGFNGKPTVVNNVETFATVPVIVDKGPEWFASIGSEKYHGTKIFSLSGDIKTTGCFEIPTNSNLKELIETLGGGMKDAKKLKAVQLGGTSCGFFKADQIDKSTDFDSLRAQGASLGSGALLVIDDSHNIVDMLVKIADFFQHESCGKCAPCREGTVHVALIVRKIAEGNGTHKDIEMLKQLGKVMSMSCFCPLGQGATVPILSALELFPEDFEVKLRRED
jgi:NADH-quinone oxidoreductase subunit F